MGSDRAVRTRESSDAESGEPNQPTGSRPCILIVDDEPAILESLELTLGAEAPMPTMGKGSRSRGVAFFTLSLAMESSSTKSQIGGNDSG
jgi:hypothetical protein